MEIKSAHVNKSKQEMLVEVHFDHDSVGSSMTLSVNQTVRVHRSGGINKSKQVFSKQFTVKESGITTHRIPLEKINVYTYQGQDIYMATTVEIRQTSGLLSYFDNHSRPVHLGFFQASTSQTSAEVMIDPPDSFDLFKNVSVLSPANQLYFLLVAVLAIVAIGANTLLGWHDQMSPSSQTLFYSHYNSDGEKQEPLFSALMVDGVLVGIFTLWLKHILRQYMSFRLIKKLGKVVPGKRYLLRNLLSGKSRVDLTNCELRVVACNVELGQYETGSGDDRKTHSFETPVKCILIHQKHLDHIPKETDIANYLKQDIHFDEVYQTLAPNCLLGSSHGVKLHWEVQLLHPELIDQEVVGSADGFFFGHFALQEKQDHYFMSKK